MCLSNNSTFVSHFLSLSFSLIWSFTTVRWGFLSWYCSWGWEGVGCLNPPKEFMAEVRFELGKSRCSFSPYPSKLHEDHNPILPPLPMQLWFMPMLVPAKGGGVKQSLLTLLLCFMVSCGSTWTCASPLAGISINDSKMCCKAAQEAQDTAGTPTCLPLIWPQEPSIPVEFCPSPIWFHPLTSHLNCQNSPLAHFWNHCHFSQLSRSSI